MLLDKGLLAFKNDDFKSAFSILKPLGHKENVKAQYILGQMYERGRPKNLKNAKFWYKKAVKHNYALSQYSLAGILLDENKHKKAFNLLIKSANQGLDLAQFELGMLYVKGIGTKANFQRGMSWIEKAAEQGNKDAIALFEKAKELDKKKQSNASMIVGLKKDCNNGDSSSCSDLGVIYYAGITNINKDIKNSKVYAKKGCLLNSAKGCMVLGVIYSEEKNSNMSNRYYDKACKLGLQEACSENYK